MKIGFYFTPHREQGGVYQYCISFLNVLSKTKGHQYIVFNTSKDFPEKFRKIDNFKILDTFSKENTLFISARNLISNLILNIFPGLIGIIYRFGMFGLILGIYKISQIKITRLMNGLDLDLMIFPIPVYLSFIVDVPAIVTIHDLEHRKKPAFKEATAGGRWEYREYGCRKIVEKAARVLVDSETTKKDLIRFYHAKPNKVIVLKYVFSSNLSLKFTQKEIIKIKNILKIPKKYVFYPAKFWSHKNHINLVKALKILKRNGKKVNLVLTGSKIADFSSYDLVMNYVAKNKLQNQVKYCGYVSDLEMSYLYKNAMCMVMPTFFGPTNIPVYEAWKMGTPVLYSDIQGCRDQLGDAGLLIDPSDPKDIAQKIWRVYINSKLRKALSKKGKIRLDQWSEKKFVETIRNVISDYEANG